jgi:predicted transcriptional regulator
MPAEAGMKVSVGEISKELRVGAGGALEEL